MSQGKTQIQDNEKETLKIWSEEELRQQINQISQADKFFEKRMGNREHTADEAQDVIEHLVKICLQVQSLLIQYPNSPKLIEDLSHSPNLAFFEDAKFLQPKMINSKAPIIQLLILQHKLYRTSHEIAWLNIAIYIAVVLRTYGFIQYSKQVTIRFKLPILRMQSEYTWLLNALPMLDESFDTRVENLINNFIALAKNEQLLAQNTNTLKKKEQKKNQVNKIALYFELAVYRKAQKAIRRKIKDLEKQEDKPTTPKAKPAYRSSQEFYVQNTVFQYQETNVKDKLLHHYQPEDIENLVSEYTAVYFSEGQKDIDFEEYIDTVQPALFRPTYYRNPSISQSIPLQIKSFSIEQQYISLKEQGFIHNPIVLTPASYQQVFSQLVEDVNLNSLANQNRLKPTTEQKCSAVLLLAMLTATPVKTLLQPKIIMESGLFHISQRRSYLQTSLGITRAKRDYDAEIFENEFDTINLPVPFNLLDFLSKPKNLPTDLEIQAYIKDTRRTLELVYLSQGRIESALQIILTHYTTGSNSHIAEIICRIPAPSAPASYYSSHTNHELVNHYRNAILWLNKGSDFDTTYLWNIKDFTTGSGYALKIDYVRDFLKRFLDLVLQADSQIALFNRYTSYVWTIFCVLTGCRPNNSISLIKGLDLETGWLEIDDKPNRATQSHRLVPLCTTLIDCLNGYKAFLSDFRHYQIQNIPLVNQINRILFGNIRQSDDHLLNFLGKNFDKLTGLKRGQVHDITQPLISLTPYWTRHFIRTQLEKRGVAMPIINAIIGHEKYLQESLGIYSSISLADIHQEKNTFEAIAQELGLIGKDELNQQVRLRLKELING